MWLFIVKFLIIFLSDFRSKTYSIKYVDNLNNEKYHIDLVLRSII